MYYQFPLKGLVRRRRAHSQLDFAREARKALHDSDDLLARAYPQGLTLYAANEEALEMPMRILRDLYDEGVVLGAPRVRLIGGEPALEPIMVARVTARAEHGGAIVAELRRRGADIQEECFRGRSFILRAQARLALLLGLPAAVRAIGQGSANVAMKLVRYAPLDIARS